MAKMKQETPYSSRPHSERVRELECVGVIFQHPVPEPQVLYEAFGGVGMLAEFFRGRFPLTRILSYELDSRCCSEYRARNLPAAKIINADTRLFFKSDLPAYEGAKFAASLDFNRFTIRDMVHKDGAFQREVLDAVFENNPCWVHITDSACSKLHLNWKSYGLSGPSWEGYCEQFDERFRSRYGYGVVAKARHHAATYFLLAPLPGGRDE